jgi:hypothetical protein
MATIKKMTKSQAVKKAKKGQDMGRKGKGFAAIVKKTTGKYGKKIANKIAGKIFWSKQKKGTL